MTVRGGTSARRAIGAARSAVLTAALAAVLGGGLDAAGQCTTVWESAVGGGLYGVDLGRSERGAFAAVGLGAGLSIVDLADRSRPRVIASVMLSGVPNSVLIRDTWAFVLLGANGIRVVDVSDPQRPWVTGAVSTGGSAIEAVIDGDRMYVAIDRAGVQVLDISDLSAPRVLQTLDTPGRVASIAKTGTRVAILDAGFGLRVYDTDASGLLTEQSLVALPALLPLDLEASGNLIYLAAERNGILAFDVSDPASVVERWRLPTPAYARNVTREGDRLYVSSGAAGVVAVVDLSDAANPRVVGSTGIGENVRSLAVRDGLAVAIGDLQGASVVDIALPSSMTVLGSTDPRSFSASAALEGNFALVAGGGTGRVDVIDLSGATGPRVVNALDTNGSVPGVTVAGDVLWVVDNGLLMSFDRTLLPQLRLLGIDAFLPGTARQLAVQNTTGYLACDAGGVGVYDLSNPASPRLRSVIDTPMRATGLAVSGDALVVADGSGGGAVVADVSNPDSPVITGTFPSTGLATAVAFATGGGMRYAYVASTLGGVQILDVTDVTRPAVVNVLPPLDRSYGMMRLGDRLYAAENASGIRTLDISDLMFPTQVARLETPGLAQGVVVGGGMIVGLDVSAGTLFGSEQPRTPRIWVQPADRVMCRGGSTTLFIGASGGETTAYQWRKDGIEISGATRAGLTLRDFSAADVGVYDCMVSNGCGTVASVAATLSICFADVDDGRGSGVCDGAVGLEDLLWFAAAYEAGDARADLDNGTNTGTPDSVVGADDLVFFLDRYSAGC